MDRQDTAAMAEMMATLNASNISLQETVKVLTTLWHPCSSANNGCARWSPSNFR